MNQLQSTTLLNDLLQQHAASVLAWLRSIESDLLKPPFGFNWLGLAEAATFEAQSASDLAWAEVATSVYERLAATANSSAQESLMISAMLLRASMIARFGSVPGHLVLDLDQLKKIVGWVERKRNPTNVDKCWVSFLNPTYITPEPPEDYLKKTASEPRKPRFKTGNFAAVRESILRRICTLWQGSHLVAGFAKIQPRLPFLPLLLYCLPQLISCTIILLQKKQPKTLIIV
ncbi:MAG: hypothetical protein DSM106950_08285 [Stigonema ocellatum SAG 48.90 = DSM 106950]|nr:hypothetical protein [Stigonema ocellatum SAG 48.90 = DSM 106950]